MGLLEIVLGTEGREAGMVGNLEGDMGLGKYNSAHSTNPTSQVGVNPKLRPAIVEQ